MKCKGGSETKETRNCMKTFCLNLPITDLSPYFSPAHTGSLSPLVLNVFFSHRKCQKKNKEALSLATSAYAGKSGQGFCLKTESNLQAGMKKDSYL